MMTIHSLLAPGGVTRCATAILISWLFMGAVLAQAADHSYLEALEQEAQGLKHLENAARLDASDNMRSVAEMERMYVTPGLSRKEFEQELSQRFAGTNTIYQTLSEEAKEAVYRDYQSDNRISVIRRNTAYSM
jgi:hypothetical protein